MPWQQIEGTHHAVLYAWVWVGQFCQCFIKYIIANMRTHYSVIYKEDSCCCLQQTEWLYIIYYIESHKHQSWSTIIMQNQMSKSGPLRYYCKCTSRQHGYLSYIIQKVTTTKAQVGALCRTKINTSIWARVQYINDSNMYNYKLKPLCHYLPFYNSVSKDQSCFTQYHQISIIININIYSI